MKTVDPTTENFCQICKAKYKKVEEAKWMGCESDKKECSYWIHFSCLRLHVAPKNMRHLKFYCPQHNKDEKCAFSIKYPEKCELDNEFVSAHLISRLFKFLYLYAMRFF